MNSGITEYYHQKIKESKLSTSELKEAIYTAIRTEDVPLLELALSKLPPDEDKWDEDSSPIVFAFMEMASCKVIELLVNHGYTLPSSPDLLPWNGDPEDIIRLICRRNGVDEGKAITDFLCTLCYYLEVMKTGYSCYRVPFHLDPEDSYKPCFLSYIDGWLARFAIYLEGKNESFEVDKVDSLIARIVQYPELIGALKSFIDSSMFKRENIGWYLRKAVCSDNESGFDILAEIAEADDFKEVWEYPKRSLRLLHKLFERNILIPGTDEGYEAFDSFISFMEKVDEEEEAVLKAIMHPSYGDRRNELGQTILMRAVLNRHFEPYLYPVLVTSPEELNTRDNEGRTALYYLAKSDYPECIEVLTRMGAIPFCVDEKGNNILHVLLSGNKMNTLYDIEDCMGYLPKCLITMENAEGKTPLDVFRDKLYESKAE